MAKAHLVAMTEPKASGQRFLCVGEPLSIISIAAILQKKFPDWPVSSKKRKHQLLSIIDMSSSAFRFETMETCKSRTETCKGKCGKEIFVFKR